MNQNPSKPKKKSLRPKRMRDKPIQGLHDFAAILKEDRKNLCMLSQTRPNVREEEFEEIIWQWLSEQYRALDGSDTIIRTFFDVINAILFQKRGVFNITRQFLQDLTRNSENWPEAIAFRDGLYPKILGDLHREGIIKLVKKGKGRAASAYEVIYEPIVKYLKDLGVDFDAQRADCIAYSQRGTDRGNRSWEPRKVGR